MRHDPIYLGTITTTTGSATGIYSTRRLDDHDDVRSFPIEECIRLGYMSA